MDMIKKYIPARVKTFLKKVRMTYDAFKSYKHDAKRYLTYSNVINISDTENKLIGQITAKYHVIEKGLTMPDMKYGFGKDIMISLITDCITFYNKYNNNNIQFQHAVGVIAEYKQIHEHNNQTFDNTLLQKINNLMSLLPKINPTEQITSTKEQFFQYTSSSFDKFSDSRHSLRNFKGNVPIEIIRKAVQLAQNAPSACNRQPTRVHIIENKAKVEKLLSIQIGNRGFGHLADKILVLTTELGIYGGVRERNMQYIDAGIYTMNLLYALHFHQVGACTINWCDVPEVDRTIRTIIDLPKSETVILLIACGGVPNNFKLTTSQRSAANQVISVE